MLSHSCLSRTDTLDKFERSVRCQSTLNASSRRPPSHSRSIRWAHSRGLYRRCAGRHSGHASGHSRCSVRENSVQEPAAASSTAMGERTLTGSFSVLDFNTAPSKRIFQDHHHWQGQKSEKKTDVDKHLQNQSARIGHAGNVQWRFVKCA